MKAAPQLIQGGSQVPAPKALAALADEIWSLKQEIDARNDELDQRKQELIEALDGQGSILKEGAYRQTVAARVTHAISDVAGLRKALGEARFDDLVETRVTYAPTKNLIAIAEDPSNPDSAKVRSGMRTSTAVSVAVKADVPKADKAA